MMLLKRCTSLLIIVTLVMAAAGRSAAAAQHVVDTQDLQQELVKSAQSRQENLAKLQGFFSSAPASKVLDKMQFHTAKLAQALPFLDDNELTVLAARADAVQKDFSAGALTNQQLTYIVIALATAVIILVIVER